MELHMIRFAAALAARGKSRAVLRADLFRQLCVARSAKYSSMSVVWRLDLTKNLSLSHAADFHHGLLAREGFTPFVHTLAAAPLAAGDTRAEDL